MFNSTDSLNRLLFIFERFTILLSFLQLLSTLVARVCYGWNLYSDCWI